MMLESKISEKGQTTIPIQVRESLGLKPGDSIRYSLVDSIAQITPTISVTSLKGVLKYDGPPKTLQDMERGIEEGATRRWHR